MEIKLREKHLLTKKSLYAYAAPGVIIRIDRDLLLLLLFKQLCNSNIYMLSLSSIFPRVKSHGKEFKTKVCNMVIMIVATFDVYFLRHSNFQVVLAVTDNLHQDD